MGGTPCIRCDKVMGGAPCIQGDGGETSGKIRKNVMGGPLAHTPRNDKVMGGPLAYVERYHE